MTELTAMAADNHTHCNSSTVYTALNTTTVCNFMETVGNQTVYIRDENLAKVEIAVQAAIFTLAVGGNVIVLIVLFPRHKKLSRMNLMIVHLSVADLFVAFFNVLPQLIWDITYRFYGNDLVCRSVKYLQVVAMYASSYVLVTTAIDRYLAIVHPMTSHTWTSQKTHLLVGVAWGLSLVFSIPQLTIFAYREVQPGVYDCWATFDPEWTLQFYITWITVAIYIVPSLLLVFAYGRICHVVWRSMRGKEPSFHVVKPKGMSWRSRSSKGQDMERGKNRPNQGMVAENRGFLTSSIRNGQTAQRLTSSENPRAHVRGLSRAKVKTVRLTMTVIICYLVCWGPWFIAQMWGVWDDNAPFTSNAMTIILLLASLNSCTNPWIYLAFSDSLSRQAVRCFQSVKCFNRNSPASASLDSESCFRATRTTADMSQADCSQTPSSRSLTNNVDQSLILTVGKSTKT